MRTARRSIGQLSGQQPKTTASPVDNDHFIDGRHGVERFRTGALILIVGGLLNAALPEPISKLNKAIGVGDFLSDPLIIRFAGYVAIAAGVLVGALAVTLG